METQFRSHAEEIRYLKNKFNNKQEIICTCEEKKCTDVICKGLCGCLKCHNDYADFLSVE